MHHVEETPACLGTVAEQEGRLTIDKPDQLAVGGTNELGREMFGPVRAFQHIA